jgi:phosphinothricin acetyltransferase
VPDITVRAATPDDLAAVNDIYNFWIRTSAANFYVDDITSQERAAWFAELGGRHRAMVAVENGKVVGFAYSGRVRPRAAYDTSVEVTVYIADGYGRRGIGGLLYEGLFAALLAEDIHRMYAVITLPNEGSVALHERFGFRLAGRFSEQGRKFGRYWDVGWYEREWPPTTDTGR